MHALRARTAREPERLLIATWSIHMPKGLWTTTFSNAHPRERLEALNRNDVDPNVSVSDYWISGRPPGVWSAEIQKSPDVLGVDALTEVGEGSLYRITYRNPPVVNLYRELGLPVQFPLLIQAGLIRWEVVARRSTFERLLSYARGVDPNLKVVSIRRQPLRTHLPILTDSQRELLNRAMAEGYFAVPRGITLTELANRLNRSKSAVSEAVALIEKKLLESAVRSSPLLP